MQHYCRTYSAGLLETGEVAAMLSSIAIGRRKLTAFMFVELIEATALGRYAERMDWGGAADDSEGTLRTRRA